MFISIKPHSFNFTSIFLREARFQDTFWILDRLERGIEQISVPQDGASMKARVGGSSRELRGSSHESSVGYNPCYKWDKWGQCPLISGVN